MAGPGQLSTALVLVRLLQPEASATADNLLAADASAFASLGSQDVSVGCHRNGKLTVTNTAQSRICVTGSGAPPIVSVAQNLNGWKLCQNPCAGP